MIPSFILMQLWKLLKFLAKILKTVAIAAVAVLTLPLLIPAFLLVWIFIGYSMHDLEDDLNCLDNLGGDI